MSDDEPVPATATATASDAFRRVLAALYRLHAEAVEGRNDGAVADRLRDLMDDGLQGLTAAERRRIEWRSGTLNDLDDRLV